LATFVVDVGSEEGSAVLAEVPHRSATAEEVAAAAVRRKHVREYGPRDPLRRRA
jgi:hypothetical protein